MQATGKDRKLAIIRPSEARNASRHQMIASARKVFQ